MSDLREGAEGGCGGHIGQGNGLKLRRDYILERRELCHTGMLMSSCSGWSMAELQQGYPKSYTCSIGVLHIGVVHLNYNNNTRPVPPP